MFDIISNFSPNSIRSGESKMSKPKAIGKLYIGTSGWSYKHWKEVFYPSDLPHDKWLQYYAERFSTVEINNSFYRLPKRETFEAWRDRTPADFTFAVKASRYITHVKKLTGVEEASLRFFENAEGLGNKLGPILFQFPANWHANVQRLSDFVDFLPGKYRYSFEFRHSSWFQNEIHSLLREKNIALCIADSPNWPTSFEITAPFTFIRLHGGRILYASEYSNQELLQWSKIITGFLDKKIDVFVYFNNDAYGYAVKNALQLREMLS